VLYLETDFGYSTPPPNDNGSRPYTGGKTPIWENSSIWLDGGSGVTQTSTHVGATTDVRVRVTNSGDADVDFVSVDAYLMDPQVGLTYPAQAIRSLSGTVGVASPGSGSTSPTDPHVALCQLPTSPASSWVPTATELANSSGGHLCLIANVYSDTDGRPLASGDPFDIVNNPHHGQRNIALLASTERLQDFQIKVMPTLEGHPTLLDIHALTSREAIGMGENWLLRSRANVVRVAQDGGRPAYYLTGSRGNPDTALSFSRKSVAGSIGLREGTVDLHEAARATKAAVERVGNADRLAWSAAEGGARIKLQATKEIQIATLSVERDDTKGSLQAFDVVQRSEDGMILGGIRIISLVTGALR
jgi:hypothetical protein